MNSRSIQYNRHVIFFVLFIFYLFLSNNFRNNTGYISLRDLFFTISLILKRNMYAAYSLPKSIKILAFKDEKCYIHSQVFVTKYIFFDVAVKIIIEFKFDSDFYCHSRKWALRSVDLKLHVTFLFKATKIYTRSFNYDKCYLVDLYMIVI